MSMELLFQIVTIGWIFLISGLFCIWEKKWNYFTAVYFFVISLSTIGLGDVVPEHTKFMVANFGFVIIGLSLVSMCINVIQQKLEELYLQLLMMILQEYHHQLASGQNQVNATMGMVRSPSRCHKCKAYVDCFHLCRCNAGVRAPKPGS